MAKKIMVVDDDFVQRDLYFVLFRDAGFDVATASDGAEAWEKIQKDKPDLVFTGIQMPKMTGFDLIDKLHNNRSTETTPVILFSHLGRPEDREKAKKLLYVEFMLKGFDSPVYILKKVKDLMASTHPQMTVLNPDEDDRQGFSVL